MWRRCGADALKLPAPPGKRTQRGGDPALEARGVAGHLKKAKKLKATIVLVDESRFSLHRVGIELIG
jgi:hypothetical protein